MCNLYRLERRGQTRLWARETERVQQRPPPEHIYPKYDAYVIRSENGERVLDVMSWGIVRTMPGKRPGTTVTKRITNVRNLSSPFWKSTLAKPEQRCLVPFSHFAEPKPGRDENNKPNNWWFEVQCEPSEWSCFAGIWRYQDGEPRFAFLTCEPNPLVAPLHAKAMPVILQPDDYDGWLSGEYDSVCALASPFPSQLMRVL
jgi:putative SOS response-associated peptidase YedK